MRSLGYKIVECVMKCSRTKEFMKLSPEKMKKKLIKDKDKIEYIPHERLFKMHIIRKEEVDSNIYYVVSPKQQVSEDTLLFVHGGAYVKKMNMFYWDVVSRLVEELRVTVYVPVYPVAPEHTYDETMDLLEIIYKKMLEEYAKDKIIVIGDSAGGQISLSFLQLLKNKKLQQPQKLILISPVLDTLPNKELIKKMKDIDKHDYILSPEFFNSGVKWWRKNTDGRNYLVNPMYGELKGLAPTTIFSGTYDILNAQVAPFLEKASKEGVHINYIEGEKMMHIWPYIPQVKECEESFNQIIEIIREEK